MQNYCFFLIYTNTFSTIFVRFLRKDKNQQIRHVVFMLYNIIYCLPAHPITTKSNNICIIRRATHQKSDKLHVYAYEYV